MREQYPKLWEAVFIAALQGSASPHAGWDSDGRIPYLINRAERIADAAVERIIARRGVAEPRNG